MNQATSTHCIGITMGDPCGIGPEICLKLVAHLSQNTLYTKSGKKVNAIIYGDQKHLKETAQQLALAIDDSQICSTSNLGPFSLSKVSPAGGKAALKAIKQAAADCLNHKLSAMVTAPIHKEALSAAGEAWPGHTELLAHLVNPAAPPDVRMLLVSTDLCVVLDSVHLSLRDAINQLNIAHILQTLRIARQAAPILNVAEPRMALAALNPHASDNGLFGHEEANILKPAVDQARTEGLRVHGPIAADTVFMRALGENPQQKDYDLVVCLYHDQGLIPMKLRGIDEGVNITLGLPFIRTSVDHGTAFDIAGRNRASYQSLLNAIKRAADFLN